MIPLSTDSLKNAFAAEIFTPICLARSWTVITLEFSMIRIACLEFTCTVISAFFGPPPSPLSFFFFVSRELDALSLLAAVGFLAPPMSLERIFHL